MKKDLLLTDLTGFLAFEGQFLKAVDSAQKARQAILKACYTGDEGDDDSEEELTIALRCITRVQYNLVRLADALWWNDLSKRLGLTLTNLDAQPRKTRPADDRSH